MEVSGLLLVLFRSTQTPHDACCCTAKRLIKSVLLDSTRGARRYGICDLVAESETRAATNIHNRIDRIARMEAETDPEHAQWPQPGRITLVG